MNDSIEEKFISENIAIILGFIKKNNMLVKVCGDYDDAVSESMFYLSKYIRFYDPQKSKPSTFITICLKTLLKQKMRGFFAKDKGYFHVVKTLSDYENKDNNCFMPKRMHYSINFDGMALYDKIYDEASENFKLYLQGYSIKDITMMQSEKISVKGMYKRLKKEAEKIQKRYRLKREDLR